MRMLLFKRRKNKINKWQEKIDSKLLILENITYVTSTYDCNLGYIAFVHTNINDETFMLNYSNIRESRKIIKLAKEMLIKLKEE